MRPTSFFVSIQLIHSCLVSGFAPLAGTKVMSSKPRRTSERRISSGTTATRYRNIPASTSTLSQPTITIRKRVSQLNVAGSTPSQDVPDEGQELSETDFNDIIAASLNKSYLLQKGKPSYPAWKNKRKLDEITEWATSDDANRPVICEYEPDAWWLW